MSFDVTSIRQQFPALDNSELVYFDSAATTQKPACVIEAIKRYYSMQNANVHRGSHSLTAHATNQFEQARALVSQFIGANSPKEIVWTRGATEALNLIAQTYARSTLQEGDVILVGESEHHANIVPWQIVAEQTGATVIPIPVKADGHLCQDAYESLLSNKVKLVAIAQTTNVTATRNPIEAMISEAHNVGAKVVIDGAQGVVHEEVNVADLDADFYVFSGHKLYAPTGIGVLYGKQALLEQMPPWHGGGKMVQKVSFGGTTYSELPGKFEAGTPNIAGAIALAEAINWYQSFDRPEIENHISTLQKTAYQKLIALDDDIKVIGYQPGSSVISFVMEGVHHEDIATLLDKQGIAVRSGHHCAHPLMDAFDIPGTVRVSFGIYNTLEDVEKLISALEKALDIL
ncbi:SufS family cysteine desulfurase [Vibrio hannami]|uniref:aminotransferase class V-fold PLP-dependent enzyme n=1 Tax=Vibrio hannami TaxID=2717094 RepID=UPI00240EBA06|nr:SufS family cysteine desulfurase [Vibrio hannami]MDG3087362.1 SufS family cysteine desulfurase [Vibrio hannami]